MRTTSASPLTRVSYNGFYSIADYLLPQLALLLAAPILLRHLGTAQLGIWMLSTAATSGSLLVTSAFGDAAVKYVAEQSSTGDPQQIQTVIRCALLVNICSAVLLASFLFAFSPVITRHVAHLPGSLAPLCTPALRLGAFLLITRSLELTYVSTLRGLLRYDTAAQITTSMRVAGLVASALLAISGYGVLVILCASILFSALSVSLLCLAVRASVGFVIVCPSTDKDTLRKMTDFGLFSWLQTLSSLGINQLDRIIAGLLLGPAAVAIYGICIQAAQPIHAFTSAAFHALFPYLSSRQAANSATELRSPIRIALLVNILMSITLSLFVIFFAHFLLSVWLGPAFAKQAALLLRVLALGYGLLSLNVTAHFSLLALGSIREVAAFNLLGAAAALALMVPLIRHFNLIGLACARLAYGPVTLGIYFTLRSVLAIPHDRKPAIAPLSILENQ